MQEQARTSDASRDEEDNDILHDVEKGEDNFETEEQYVKDDNDNFSPDYFPEDGKNEIGQIVLAMMKMLI